MEGSTKPPKDAVIALLNIWCLSEGGDICDRCGGIIWPEIELVRCDMCVGKHGAPERERLLEAERKHRSRIAAYEREMAEEYPCDA